MKRTRSSLLTVEVEVESGQDDLTGKFNQNSNIAQDSAFVDLGSGEITKNITVDRNVDLRNLSDNQIDS